MPSRVKCKGSVDGVLNKFRKVVFLGMGVGEEGGVCVALNESDIEVLVKEEVEAKKLETAVLGVESVLDSDEEQAHDLNELGQNLLLEVLSSLELSSFYQIVSQNSSGLYALVFQFFVLRMLLLN